MLRTVSLTILFSYLLIPTATAENWCANDNLCEQVAIGIAKQHVSERLQAEIDAIGSTTALCPENDPDCCPKELRHLCSQASATVIDRARHEFETSVPSPFAANRCPFTPAICNSIDSWCEADEHWTPWGGCSEAPGFALPACPPGHSEQADGSCKTWSPCECGYTHNWKGICIPKKCYKNGHQIPCTFACDLPPWLSDINLRRTSTSDTETTALRAQLERPVVQLRALESLKAELRTKLELIDKEIGVYKRGK